MEGFVDDWQVSSAGLYLLVFLLSLFLTALLLRYAAVLGIQDQAGHRSLHSGTMPRTGGLAIIASILIGFIVIHRFFIPLPHVSLLLTSLLLIAAIAFLDDLWSLPTGLRLLVQMLVVLIVLKMAIAPTALQLPGFEFSLPPPVSLIVTFLFLLWFINLYNFMDGMDGFAAGMAVIGFSTYAILGWVGQNPAFIMVNFCIACAAAGFLRYNLPPAKLFMGDSGSSILGLLAGMQTLVAESIDLFPIWVGILVFSPFVVDATFTLLRRLWRRERIWEAHRSHCYQRLVLSGWGHRRTVRAEYVLMLLAAVSAVIAVSAGAGMQQAIVALWALTYGALIIWVSTKKDEITG